MMKIKTWIENNPGWSMIILTFAGLAFPYGGQIPDNTIIGMLATLIFLSCFKINMPLRSVLSLKPFVFCFLRFICVPVLMFLACKNVVPTYALGILLLALAPAGASSAAVSGMYHGNVALGLLITIISSVACVFSIPSIIGFLNHQDVAIPALSLLKTLVLCILLPGCLYLMSQKNTSINTLAHTYGRMIVISVLSLLAFVGVSKKRDYFLLNPESMITPFLIVTVFFILVEIVSFAVKTRKQDRIAYGVCSTFNNTSLGVGLSILYFDANTVAVLIAALFVWSFLPMFVAPIMKRLSKLPEEPVGQEQ